MKARICLMMVVGFVLAACTSAFADEIVSADEGAGAQGSDVIARMRIDPNGKTSDAKLIIPRSVLQQLTAQTDGNGSVNLAATSNAFFAGRAQTVMTGIFLSLAIAFGGVWFVRRRKETGRLTGAAIGLAFLALCGTVASVYGNAGPPPVARSLTSKILIQEVKSYGVYGEVKVSIVDNGNQIVLVLAKPKDDQPR